MSVNTPNFTRKVKFEVWSMSEDFTLIKIMYPKKEKGIATLKRKQNMWNYLQDKTQDKNTCLNDVRILDGIRFY